MDCLVASLLAMAWLRFQTATTIQVLSRHCEWSEAIQLAAQRKYGLLRFARNDDL